MSKRLRSRKPKEESRNALEHYDSSNSLPSRWWRSAAPFPVVAGTLCAIAIMFNICTVSQGWQEKENVDGSITILSQPTWMVALKAVSLALAGVTTRRHPILQPQQSLKYTQSYFYGILTASLYIFIAILLVAYTAIARSVSLSRHDRRTVEYTSIILRTITFITVLTGGAGVYSTVEEWSFMDALYFTDYTVLTIGIGNIVPKTHLGRSLLFPYATAGIIALGLVVSSITSFGKSIRNLRLKLELQEARNRLLEQKKTPRAAHHEHNDDTTLSSIPSTATFPQTSDVAELQRIRSDFNRRVQWQALLFFVTAWFVLWLLSAAVFRRSERGQNWTYFTALYFTYTSLTTIGYGDFYPTSNFGKVFFVFWSLLAIPVLTNLVTVMGEIGVRTLVYFGDYILRLGKSRRETGHKKKDDSDLASSKNFRDIEKQAQWSSNLKKASEDMSTVGTTSTFANNELELSQSMIEAGQHRFLLAEEIKKLVLTLLEGSSEQDPRRDWPWVLSLLHSRDGEASNSAEYTFPDIMNQRTSYAYEGLSSDERTAIEKNNEALLMLKWLTEKLCSELGKGAGASGP
ncbi:hypothetical protein BDV38DRAFT_279230 [Aspergillus pseudotamarii]|uniref:Potassium channel domain-containing protein n=1 Tax=Aspergillus pseudotamarii TaxID=132259 RepID=A0A5N6T4U2_ASPPS|nr:uncharacterized protein BDV38DRAFT_279230 [Aspergillus pseudotamarii]KAE8141327.1 hypothetical protein BDV38DRAFT_279230 [Aspergillus pseudotamarii]